MSYFESSKLKIPRRIRNCAKCGTKDLGIVRDIMFFGSPEYEVHHLRRYCSEPYWYTKGYTKINAAVRAWNKLNDESEFQDIDRIWFEVDRVYETRWDCMAVPEGVRAVA